MTYDESTLFMKFMQGKGVMNNFDYLYRSHRYDKKKDLEQYMDEVDAEDVILSAFDMSGAGNTIFGVKYWQEINDKWQAKLTEFRNTGILTADEAQVYCPHCQRVLPRTAFATKSNGVLHKHCRECEGGKWDRDKKEREKAEKEAEKQAKAMKQLEKEIAEKQAKLERQRREIQRLEDIKADAVVGEVVTNNRAESARREIAEGQANLNKTTKVCGHCGKRKLRTEFYKSDASEDGLQEYCKTCQTELLAAAEEAQHREDEKRRLEIEIAEREAEVQRMRDGDAAVAQQQTKQEAAESVVSKPKPLKPDKLVAPKLGEYDATLHYKQNQKSLTLNATLSEQIRKGEFSKCYLNIDRSKHAFLIFNRVEGANVTGASTLTQALLNVTSADIARTLAARFDLDLGENYYLHITKNLSKKDEFLTIEVLAARSREEYIKIAERRELVAKGKIPPYEAEDGPKTLHEDKANNEDDEVKAATFIEDKTEEPVAEPLLDFGDAHLDMKDPAAILDYLTENGYITERDLAVYLHQKGWELQEPVIVKKLKKFSL
jgi:hypothetical protein